MTKKAVVLLSGGQDSTTCLALAKADGHECYAISVNYNQRNVAEIEAAKKICKHFNVKEHKMVNVNLDTIGGSALTDNSIQVHDYQEGLKDIPSTYVPARNTLFLSLALGYAEVVEAQAIYIGVTKIDYDFYPDCRPDYIEAYQAMANLATATGVKGNTIKIVTPLIHFSKADTVKAGITAGVDYSMTVTCYRADQNGNACGTCHNCVLRKQGFEEAGVADPTRYQEIVTP